MCRFIRFWPIAALCGWVALAAILGATPATAATPTTANDLVRSDPATLDALYAAGNVRVPSGFLPGRAIYKPGTRQAVPASRLIHPLWQGKIFNDDGTGKNRLFGLLTAVPTKVYVGESWRDGNPAVIFDYADSWKMFRKVRDEFREVSPGLFLGLTYLRNCPEPELAMRFALQERDACGR